MISSVLAARCWIRAYIDALANDPPPGLEMTRASNGRYPAIHHPRWEGIGRARPPGALLGVDVGKDPATEMSGAVRERPERDSRRLGSFYPLLR